MFCSVCGAQVSDADRFCPKCGRGMSSASPVAYAAQPGTGGAPAMTRIHYGGFWIRFVAYIIDSFVVGIPMGIILLIFISVLGGAAVFHAHFPAGDDLEQWQGNIPAFLGALFAAFWVIFLCAIAVHWLYSALFESSAQQATLGKMAFSLQVTDLNGNRITFGRATGRYFGKVVNGFIPFYIGFIIAGFTEKKQALHDFIASTVVSYKE